ncbi:plasmid pRiA4b ORF-3 family protein [Moorella sp. E308F]|jgi:hypothetical protein|uniref:plasmid pRiA4b ORF-3 family protein n=1 Tax=unclassified Neomoorella TaxID=2676739 RepID=UPI0010FFBE26|nr:MULTISPECIES: plasmid pRiA4b ORF-3 family protein [unclassified Moorella (in: firmicutes)]GEA15841.1 plasmid pRiA4b ORF-3 family protein [Moorella sp. E308F]GEA19332.1 plasmid pRiA4b ORF-3 family protein [Moorella sp. E306M]
MAKQEKVDPWRAVYQFKVTLRDVHPPVWRRFQVTRDISLYRLHLVLQAVMGWWNYHLYQFIIRGTYYCDPDPEFDAEYVNARRVKLWQVLTRPRMKFLYEYDFGDGWEHELVLEKILPPAEGTPYPICLEGARACPPEDCGGSWGYARMLEILSNPDHEEYEETVEWLGGEFDPEAFDIEEVNRRLRRLRVR